MDALQYQNEYYQKNKEKCIERSKIYYQKNKEKVLKKMSEKKKQQSYTHEEIEEEINQMITETILKQIHIDLLKFCADNMTDTVIFRTKTIQEYEIVHMLYMRNLIKYDRNFQGNGLKIFALADKSEIIKKEKDIIGRECLKIKGDSIWGIIRLVDKINSDSLKAGKYLTIDEIKNKIRR